MEYVHGYRLGRYHHRIVLRALHGKLVFAIDRSPGSDGCVVMPPFPVFNVMTTAQQARYEFLVAQQGCQQQPAADLVCEDLAKHHRDGRGTPRDPARARSVLAQSCQRGGRINCHVLAKWLLAGKHLVRDVSAARRFTARSCRLSFWRGCKLYLSRFLPPRGAAT